MKKLKPEQIRTILLRDWDPLGVEDNKNLSDEYDFCIPIIQNMIEEGATENEIAQYLISIDIEWGGSNMKSALLAASNILRLS